MVFESFVARRFLKIKSQRKLVPLITILATLGVSVGVMVLIVVIAVMTGFQSELRRRILGIESHINISQFNGWIKDSHGLLKKIGSVSGVQSASPYVYAQGMLRSADGVSAVVLKGIDPSLERIQLGKIGQKEMTDLLSDKKRIGAGIPIVLGQVLADKLKVKAGSGLLLMLVGSGQGGRDTQPGMQRLTVVGLFDTGMHQYDGTMGFVDIHQMQKMIGVGDLATGIGVRLYDSEQAGVVGAEILAIIGDSFWASNWQYTHKNLFSMLALQKVMMYVILTLIILVAAFNIASALIMMVKDKVKDIAILKVMGANRKSIQTIFLGKGLMIGLTGICLGCGAGLLLCLLLARYPFVELPGDVYFLTTLPVEITSGDLLVIILGTLGICISASLYPARKAANMSPVEGIRYR